MTVFDHEWRMDHAKAGDQALRNTDALFTEMIKNANSDSVAVNLVHAIQAYAAIAQAHYAAANVRAKPIVTEEGEL